MPRSSLKSARRIVVKLGTALLTDELRGLDTRLLGRLAGQVATLRQHGREVVIVSSGAIGVGGKVLGFAKRPAGMATKQAAAAVGQAALMAAYSRTFRRRGLLVSQVLLTRDDLLDRRRYTNLLNVFERLLRLGVVPVVNENDSVAVDEIRVGDNDVLSALVSMLVGADALLILTVVGGLYSAEPGAPGSRLISAVEKVDAGLRKSAGKALSAGGTGGMQTKLEAARMVTQAGAVCAIASGRERRILERLLAGEEIGTAFYPGARRLEGRRRWLAFVGEPQGVITVDAGARRAMLEHKKSLLPAGVVGIAGEFRRGEIVLVKDCDGGAFARGIVNFDYRQLKQVAGRHTSEISRLLGTGQAGTEVIHRDNMVVGEGTW